MTDKGNGPREAGAHRTLTARQARWMHPQYGRVS